MQLDTEPLSGRAAPVSAPQEAGVAFSPPGSGQHTDMGVLAIEYGLSALSLGPETPTHASAAVAMATAEAAMASPSSPRRGFLLRTGRTGGPPSPVKTSGVEQLPESLTPSDAQAVPGTTGRSDSTQGQFQFGGHAGMASLDPHDSSPAWSTISEGVAARGSDREAGDHLLRYALRDPSTEAAEGAGAYDLGSRGGIAFAAPASQGPSGGQAHGTRRAAWDTPANGGRTMGDAPGRAGAPPAAASATSSGHLAPPAPYGHAASLPAGYSLPEHHMTAPGGYMIAPASAGGFAMTADPGARGHSGRDGGGLHALSHAPAVWAPHGTSSAPGPVGGVPAFAHSGPSAAQALDARTPNPRKLFVGGLGLDVSDADLFEHFSQFGGVSSAVVMRNKVTGAPRGFGFVVFESGSDAGACLSVPQAIRGRPIDISPAYPKQQPAPRRPPPMPYPPYAFAPHPMGPGMAPAGFAYAAVPQMWGGGVPMVLLPAGPPPAHSPAAHPRRHPQRAPAASSRPDGSLRRIFVGGLPQDTTEDDLVRHFAKFGEIVDCEVMRDRINGRSRGFGFVTYGGPTAAAAAVGSPTQMMRDTRVDVSFAHPREVGRTRLEMMTPADAARSAAAAEGAGQPHALGRAVPGASAAPPQHPVPGWAQ